MKRTVVYEESLTAIADAIREKTNTDKTYTPGEMPQGVEEAYEAGKKTEYDAFWDAFQNNGKLVDYRGVFGADGWCDEIFKPKYDMQVSWADFMFYNSRITDITNTGVTIDFKNSINFNLCFGYAEKLVHIGTVDTRGMDSSSSAGSLTLNQTFCACTHLETIDKLILKSNGNQYFSSNCFWRCDVLKNITIEGVIGNSISFSCSPLSKESIKSIINALSVSTNSQILTLNKNAVNTAFDINIDDATTYPVDSEFYNLRYGKSNWTFVYA